MVSIFQYKIKCPYCDTEISVVSEESNPIIFLCKGCHNHIVIEGNIVYNVSKDTVEKVMKKVKIKQCGRVVKSRLNPKHVITQKEIDDLSKILEQTDSVTDILKKL